MNSARDSSPLTLPKQYSGEQVPDISRCLLLFDQYGMLPNIRDHSIMVARVADTLTKELHSSLPQLARRPDRNLVIAAALLHDIAKTECIKTGGRHAKVGQQICNKLGFPTIGAIVAEHVVLQNFRETDYKNGHFGAKELVFYADKRVLHDKVVSLEERLAYILDRYGNDDPVKHQKIRHYFNHSRVLEAHIFSFLPFKAEQLAGMLLPDTSTDLLITP